MEKTEKSNLIYLSKLNNEIKEINETKNVINTEKFEIPKEKIRYYIFDNIKGILIFIYIFFPHALLYFYIWFFDIFKFNKNYKLDKIIDFILFIQFFFLVNSIFFI